MGIGAPASVPRNYTLALEVNRGETAMFRVIIAYGELIFGFPILVASLLMFVPNILFATTLARSSPSAFQFITSLLKAFSQSYAQF